ncbi:MAG: LLM class flavin-dependent oxidoreductase [Chloroflexi bacterium]|nr:LLM class flavin-dependent oxidoreductase [Chloroflexota bacterium]
MKFGLVSLGDHLPDPATGRCIGEAGRFRQLVELGVLAEKLGYWSYHLGEHHFSDYIVSSPMVVQAAIAERTSRIRLSTAVSLLGHRDAVTVAEDYATVDVLSGGRAELIAGRGVYRGHYAQFGQSEAESSEMLTEAVQLLRLLWTEERAAWSGKFRAPLTGVTVHPRPVQSPHPPIWLSASSPESVDRAVALGCPISIPTISVGVKGPPLLAKRYREGWAAAGRDPAEAQISLHVHCFVGEGSTEEAVREWAPHQASYLRWVYGEIVGATAALPPDLLEFATPRAQAVCGSAEYVIGDLERRIEGMGGCDLLLIQCDQGGLAPERVAAAVERFATQVAPPLSAES